MRDASEMKKRTFPRSQVSLGNALSPPRSFTSRIPSFLKGSANESLTSPGIQKPHSIIRPIGIIRIFLEMLVRPPRQDALRAIGGIFFPDQTFQRMI